MRKSRLFSIFVLLCLLVITSLVIVSKVKVARFNATGRDLGEITAALKLTDISFSNDARYTKNPSQADIFSAFQDYPGSIEHFPSGSVIPPPDFSPYGAEIKVRRK